MEITFIETYKWQVQSEPQNPQVVQGMFGGVNVFHGNKPEYSFSFKTTDIESVVKNKPKYLVVRAPDFWNQGGTTEIPAPDKDLALQQLITLLDILDMSQQESALQDKLDDVFKMYRLIKP